MDCLIRKYSAICLLCLSMGGFAAGMDESRCYEYIPGLSHSAEVCTGEKPLSGGVHDLKDLRPQKIQDDLYAGKSAIAGYGLFTKRPILAGEEIYTPYGVWVRGIKLYDGKRLAWYMDNGKPVILNETLGQEVRWNRSEFQVPDLGQGVELDTNCVESPVMNFGILDVTTLSYQNNADYSAQKAWEDFGVRIPETFAIVSNPNVHWSTGFSADEFAEVKKMLGVTPASIKCLKARYPYEFCGIQTPLSLSFLGLLRATPLIALEDIEAGAELVFNYNEMADCYFETAYRYIDRAEDYEANVDYYLPLIEYVELQIGRHLNPK
ncbi:MAG: hypothetical protein ACR2PT_16650 [Endozoicomonas sp.]